MVVLESRAGTRTLPDPLLKKKGMQLNTLWWLLWSLLGATLSSSSSLLWRPVCWMAMTTATVTTLGNDWWSSYRSAPLVRLCTQKALLVLTATTTYVAPVAEATSSNNDDKDNDDSVPKRNPDAFSSSSSDNKKSRPTKKSSSSAFASSSSSSSIAANCPDRCQRYAPYGERPSVPPAHHPDYARIFYILLLHNEQTAWDAVHLVRAIRHVRHTLFIHVDTKAEYLLSQPSLPLWHELAECPCGMRLHVESSFDVKWGNWTMNLPTLRGMKVAVDYFSGEWDVVVNLAGDAYPVYEPTALSKILAQLPYNFVTSSWCSTGLLPTNVYHFPKHWHKRRHYTMHGLEMDPVVQAEDSTDGMKMKNTTVIAHFGSQWVILQAPFVAWMAEELGRGDSFASRYARYLELSNKLMTDEAYLPTMLMHVPPDLAQLPRVHPEHQSLYWANGTLSSRTTVRYERMDEHIPNIAGVLSPLPRYNVTEETPASVARPRVWGPYYLGAYDLGIIRRTGALFLRRVSMHVDPNLLRILPVQRAAQIPQLFWPQHGVSATPGWRVSAVEWYRKMERDQKRAKEECYRSVKRGWVQEKECYQFDEEYQEQHDRQQLEIARKGCWERVEAGEIQAEMCKRYEEQEDKEEDYPVGMYGNYKPLVVYSDEL